MEPKPKAGKIVALILVLFAFSASAWADTAPFPELGFTFPTSTLVGYGGGLVCSLSDNVCSGLVSGIVLTPEGGACGLPGAVCAENASFTPGQALGTFDLSGILTDGALLGGTMTLNEVTGMVTTVSFTVGAPDSFATSIIGYDGGTTLNGNTFWLLNTNTVAPVPEPGSVLPAGTATALMGALLWLRRRAHCQRPILP